MGTPAWGEVTLLDTLLQGYGGVMGRDGPKGNLSPTMSRTVSRRHALPQKSLSEGHSDQSDYASLSLTSIS